MPGAQIIHPRLLKKPNCSESCHHQSATDRNIESSAKLVLVSSTETLTLHLDGPCSFIEGGNEAFSLLIADRSCYGSRAGPQVRLVLDMQELTAGFLLQQLPLAVDDTQDQ